jgi:murein DD-endopeptidase MepM/ murein hydrolase activator NlpD
MIQSIFESWSYMKKYPLARKKKEKKKMSHLTMMVIPHCQGARIKNYRIPIWVFKSFMVLSITCIIIVTYFTSGYFLLRYTKQENIELKEINITQAKEINELKGLAGSMRDKLEYLIQLDQEVREKVGLAQKNKEETEVLSTLQSSRSYNPYQLITMSLGPLPMEKPLSITEQIGKKQYSNSELSVVSVANVIPQGVAMELPVFENEIDTLEELKDQLALMDTMMTQQEESMNKLNTDVDQRLAYLQALPDAWPIQGRITSWFGWRANPYSHRGREFHDGIDIASTYGSPIRTAGDGVVTYAGYKGSWGRLVVISHGYGYVSQYAHNSSILVKTGDRVKKGDVIARLGNTGRSTGPHVHFGVAKNGTWINPMDLINEAKERGE